MKLNEGVIYMTGQKDLKKELGLFTLVSLGVGSILGSGIFALPAVMGAVAGPSLILAIFLAGVITFFLGIVYAELGAAYPLEGGPYSLPRLAMGDFGGFFMGWGYFLYLFIGTAALIDIFIVYLGYYIPALADGGSLTPLGVSIAVVALWIFTFINIVGVKWGGLYAVVTTVGKLIPMILFGLVAFLYFTPGNFVPFMPFGFTGVTLGITLFFWSYTGFEAVVVPAGEVKKPSRTIPLAMLLTVLISIAVYLFIAFAFVGFINWKGLSLAEGDWSQIGKLTSPLSDVAKGSGLLWLGAVATIGAIIATAGSSGSWVLIQGRMPYSMAKDNLFWAQLGKLHPKYKTPASSLIFTSLLTTIILIAIPNFPSVALIASVTAVVPYAAACLSVPILRRADKKTPRPFKLPAHFFVSLMGFTFATYLIYWASWPWNVVGASLMATGYPVFLLVKNKKYEFRRNLWIPVYLVAIIVVSLLGDPTFTFNNFTPIKPLGYLMMPYDIVALTIVSISIFVWAYFDNVKVLETEEGQKFLANRDK